jgi:hypothetical protein
MVWPSRWPAWIALSCLGVGALIVAGADGPVALAATLWFLFACAGMAFVPLLPPLTPLMRVAAVVAVSLAMDAAVATAMVLAGRFSPKAGILALIGLCLVGCGLQIRRWPVGWAALEMRLHKEGHDGLAGRVD